ncbi:hypothetical protein ABOM_007882 [Aspergillus bombycis]|uniref:Xylose isomerase-like TIM barrel domain-containing protein n=1 Tax=Aspergillus bombycis TaxID=109264 RepID=A0A1F7ZTB5_9EURO|nr:hypothetical protein ABOM_007882 [Aspergillus bombycis]OGM42325.1 hypothetical protein ABOM_007882 [Aspergillus bombycis]
MSFQPAIASPSLGHQTVHPITSRLEAAASHGFKLIELVEDDLAFYARDQLGEVSESTTIQAAIDIKIICDRLNIKPCVLQPFWFYEGLLDPQQHAVRISKLRLWMQLVKILGIRIVQVPTNWMKNGTTGDIDAIVKDFREMASIGLEQDPPVCFAYEGVAWGTHIDTWQGTWEIVKRVNKPNFGLCLDTYHIAARVWGDPTAPGCKRSDGDEALRRSMEELATTVDVHKIFYVQLSDAKLLDQPLIEDHPFYNMEQPPRMSWSRNARLFPWEKAQNGSLPLEPIVHAIFMSLKFEGIVTVETFSNELFHDDPKVPDRFATRAKQSWCTAMQKINSP